MNGFRVPKAKLNSRAEWYRRAEAATKISEEVGKKYHGLLADVVDLFNMLDKPVLWIFPRWFVSRWTVRRILTQHRAPE